MARTRTRTFRNGNSEAVRLPREVAFGRADLDLTVIRTGDVITIYPTQSGPKDLVARLAELPRPTDVQGRDPVEVPERVDG